MAGPVNSRATRYTPETDEAIWALLCDGVGAAEVLRRLASDDAGIGYPVDMKRRTFFDHVARLKRERGDPRAYIRPGQEVDAARAIERRTLETMAAEGIEIQGRQKAGEQLSPSDLAKLRTIGKHAHEIATRDVAPVKSAQHQDAGNARAVSDAALLRRLSKLAAEPVPDHPPVEENGAAAGVATASASEDQAEE